MPTSQKRQRKRDGREARMAALRAQRRQQRQRRIVVAIVLVLVLVLGLSQFVSGGGGGDTEVATVTTTTPAARKPAELPAVPPGESITGDTPCPKPDGSSPRTTSFEKAPPMCINPSRPYTAEIRTSKGVIVAGLDAGRAPKTVNNFVVLSRYHFYDGIAFHRIVPGFVIQGGDPQATGRGDPGYRFEDELPQAGQYKVGSLAMANSGPNTNGSQFFIITGDTGATLPPNYSLFGQVNEGLDVVRAIEAAGTPEGVDPNGGKPTEVVKIETITIREG